jgi:hypothetical protein
VAEYVRYLGHAEEVVFVLVLYTHQAADVRRGVRPCIGFLERYAAEGVVSVDHD